MGSLLTARNLPGIGDFDPPEDEPEAPECHYCDGFGTLWDDVCKCFDPCPNCTGTGKEPDYDPPMEEP